jgi:PBP1b-binding outer membrane lipoprotein LpoB
MTFKSSLLLVALAVAITACGSGEAPPQEQKPQRKQTVFDPLTSTIDRAKGVQQTVDDQAAEQRKKIEAAEK